MTGKGGRKKKKLGNIVYWELPIALSFGFRVNPLTPRSV